MRTNFRDGTLVPLQLEIDSRKAKEAAEALDALTDAGARSEHAAEKVGRSWKDSVEVIASGVGSLNNRFSELNTTQAEILSAAERSSASLDRDAELLERIASQATTLSQALTSGTTKALNETADAENKAESAVESLSFLSSELHE